ncbi:GumC family protein [Aurantiacibacter gangjinensis]|uniref:non-specific protein-tyrosine kinase n=1 Tax=Aurantiacibacter gangjinensis TaxID=502682 RepID=A0A0G9ML73_9SPHN|nr:polysaccharide biosynthesis tyrosine autokinase [Aurantiacibacter gangjinensis]APE27341.1 Tyrosine-protein kinase EpsD [Aurantiacibacter gangjinensis]KLE31437.1 hypothetical protein AAW01_07540 [Aurantiacibacter gangjinensis]
MNEQISLRGEGDPNVDPYWDDPDFVADGNPYGRGKLVNFGVIRAMLWRQRFVLAGLVGAALLAGLVITMLMTPIYAATSSVRVDSQPDQLIEGQELVNPYIGANEIDRYLLTLTHEVTSRDMALKVEEELDLANNAAFLGLERDVVDGHLPAEGEARREQTAIAMLQGNLEVEVPLMTSVISMTYESPNPEIAAAVANAYATNFLSSDIERALEANSYALEFLDEQIVELRAELQDAERAAINYARANRLVGEALQSQDDNGDDAGAPATLSAANLGNINRTYTEARAERIAAEQRWRSVRDIPPAQLPEVRTSSYVEQLRGQLAEAQADLVQLRERYQDDYPDIRQLEARIATLRSDIATAGAEIKASIRNDYTIALRQERALAGELERQSSVTLDEQDRRVQFNLLDREVQARRSQLAALLARYNQVSSAANLQSSNATLLEQAVVPDAPVAPNLFKNLVIAFVLGTGLAVALAILREVLDDRLRSTEDVERVLGVRALGHTPNIDEADIASDIDDTFSHLSEAYASIRATLDYRLAKGRHSVIQVTSSGAGEGKTTTAIALARRYAMLDRKVLLMDVDLRRPSVTRQLLGERPSKGLTEVLMGEATFDEAILKGGDDSLDVLGLAALPNEPVEMLSSGLLPAFIQSQRPNYDIILLDSSPVMGIADAPLLARAVDATVFVVEANVAHNGQAKAAISRLRQVGANIVGAVLAKFRALEAAGDYSYTYSYYNYQQKAS